MYRAVRKQIEEGRQVYIVYPLIKESEKIDLKNLEEGYQHILEEFPGCTVAKVHGKMKSAEKDEQMQALYFRTSSDYGCHYRDRSWGECAQCFCDDH